jgi:hypothetical protein
MGDGPAAASTTHEGDAECRRRMVLGLALGGVGTVERDAADVSPGALGG